MQKSVFNWNKITQIQNLVFSIFTTVLLADFLEGLIRRQKSKTKEIFEVTSALQARTLSANLLVMHVNSNKRMIAQKYTQLD